MDQKVQEGYYTAQMLEDIPIAVALVDARDFRVITANRCFSALFANTIMERKNSGNSQKKQRLPDFFSAPNASFVLELFRSVIQTGKAYQSQEFPLLHPERGLTYWSGSVTPIHDTPGQTEQLLIAASDVTEQVKARLQAESKLSKQTVETEVQRLAAMETVARYVSKELVSKDIARVACEALVATLNPICICIHLTQPLVRELRLAHMYIDEHDQAAASLQQMVTDLQRVDYDSSHWIARARHYHEPVLLRHLHDIPKASDDHPSQILANGGYICIPLWFKDHLEGTLVVLFRETLNANNLLVRILKDCCTCISAALAHSRLLAEVELERVRLRAILDHLPEGIFLADASNKCISYANEAAAHILDAPGDYLLGLSIEKTYEISPHHFSFTHKGQQSDNPNVPLLRALTGETIVGEEIQFTRPDSTIVTLLVAAAPIRDEMGTLTGAVSIFQDITQRKSIEEQKSEFLSIASHELRTPTTAIQGFAEILQMFAEQNYEPTSSHTLRIVESILEQSTRLTHLINEMLDISLIEHQQLILHPAQHDLITTVRRAVKHLAEDEQQRAITVTLQGVASDEPLVGIFDEERILQVLNNFMSNAIKYSQAGSEIEVGLRYDQAQPDRVLLWVRDTGIGIPANDLPHIFERFHRAENFDRSISGLGIGLYLAREIVLSHGGSIRAKSQEGIGSIFSVELPLLAPEPPPARDKLTRPKKRINIPYE
jgi:PAS domain S-box-containing protein